jgi:hypothetical protein
MCKRACWPTPQEAEALLDAGYANKLMLDAWHFRFYSGSPGYSELTPGEETTMSCAKKVWTFSVWSGIEIKGRRYVSDDIVMALLPKTAETCKHFEVDESVVEAVREAATT